MDYSIYYFMQSYILFSISIFKRWKERKTFCLLDW